VRPQRADRGIKPSPSGLPSPYSIQRSAGAAASEPASTTGTSSPRGHAPGVIANGGIGRPREASQRRCGVGIPASGGRSGLPLSA
jgi:hypothetical protein